MAARDKTVVEIPDQVGDDGTGPPDDVYAFFLAAAAVASYMMGVPIMMDA